VAFDAFDPVRQFKREADLSRVKKKPSTFSGESTLSRESDTVSRPWET
jgi:hypothetical protein